MKLRGNETKNLRIHRDAVKEVHARAVPMYRGVRSIGATLSVQMCWIEDAEEPLAGRLRSRKRKKEPRTSPANEVTLLRSRCRLSSHLLCLLCAIADDSCRGAGG